MINFHYYLNQIGRYGNYIKFILLLSIFLFLYFLIISQFIDLFTDKKVLENVDINCGSINSSNNLYTCEVHGEKCPKRALKIGDKIVDVVCDLTVPGKNNRAFTNLLKLDDNLFQRKICITHTTKVSAKTIKKNTPDATFIIEEEDGSGHSLFDLRDFGTLVDNNHCLLLNSGATVVPIQIGTDLPDNSQTSIQIARNLINKKSALFILYTVALIFISSLFNSTKDLKDMLLKAIGKKEK